MISMEIDPRQRHSPVPLSLLICTASTFDCHIYVKCNKQCVNVKCYDEMMCYLKPSGDSIMFLFSGRDEDAAQRKIQMIFQ